MDPPATQKAEEQPLGSHEVFGIPACIASDAYPEGIDVHAAFPHQRKFHSYQCIYEKQGRGFRGAIKVLDIPENAAVGK
jgi:hypothetical protein